MSSPKIVFSGVGTHGDVLPLLALAGELKRRGHSSVVLANQSFKAQAEQMGVEFVGVTVEQKNNLLDHQQNLDAHILPSYDPTIRYFKGLKKANQRAVVVNLDEFSASNLMCELQGLPLCRLHLAPTKIRSLVAPCWPHSQRSLGPLGATYTKHILPKYYATSRRSPAFLKRLNVIRVQQGLARIESTGAIDQLVTEHICLFPSWFASPASDWPSNLQQTDFPLPSSDTALPQVIHDFIQRWGKPLVFTPGAGVLDVDQFFQDAQHCCAALGLPAVFLSRNLLKNGIEFGPRTLPWSYVNLQALPPHCRLLVHHGGSGTTARALQAGTLQVVRPVAYDQPDNAHRVQSLGVGATLVGAAALRGVETSADSLTGLVRSLLSYRRRLSGAVGLSQAARIIEKFATPPGQLRQAPGMSGCFEPSQI